MIPMGGLPKTREELDHYGCFVMESDLKEALETIGENIPEATGGIFIPRGLLSRETDPVSYEVWLTSEPEPQDLSTVYRYQGEYSPKDRLNRLPRIFSVFAMSPRSVDHLGEETLELADKIREHLSPHHIADFRGPEWSRIAIYQARNEDGTLDRIESVGTRFFHYADPENPEGRLWSLYRESARILADPETSLPETDEEEVTPGMK